MALYASNNAEGGSNGTTVTTSNSGGSSGNAFTGVVGTVTFATAAGAHGALGYSVQQAASSACNIQWDQTLLGSITDHYGRLYVNYTSLPSSSNTIVTAFDGTGVQSYRIDVTATGNVRLRNAANTQVGQTTAGMSAATWYRIEWHVVSSSTSGTFVVNLYSGDSTSAIETVSLTSQNTNTSTGRVYFGPTVNSPTVPTHYFDSLALADNTTGWLGPDVAAGGSVTAVPATATGSSTAPAVAGAASVTSAAITATAASTAPLGAVGETAPAITATAASTAPTVVGDAAVTVPPITATAAALPTVTVVNGVITSPAITASAGAPTPLVNGGISIPPATASAGATAPSVSVLTDASITAVPATASGQAPVTSETITGGDTVSGGGAAAATASAAAPTINSDNSLTAVPALATATPPVPLVTGTTGNVSVTAVPATASAASAAVTLVTDFIIGATAAIAQAAAAGPAVHSDAALMLAPQIQATASVPVPTVAADPIYTFIPPTHAMHYGDWPVQPLTSRIKYPTGTVVLKTAGFYTTVDSPSESSVIAADVTYLGGHAYIITKAEADALTAAGYGANITVSH